MLRNLSIKNIALIDNLSIELTEGLNCITGETGAGKSLIIDSISLLLGERADKSLITRNKDFAYVEAVFETENVNVLNALESFGLEKENTIIISRKISNDGRNECRVNGKAFTLSMLKKITHPLMDLHGQFEHQTLLQVSNHIKVLDAFDKDAIFPYLLEYRNVFDQLRDVKSELSSFTSDEKERERLIELYKFQIEEIESANFKDNEEEELKEFRVRVLSQEKIMSSLKNSLDIVRSGGYGGASLPELIARLSAEISSVSSYVPQLKNLSDRLDNVKFEFIDIIDTLEAEQDNMYFNEFEAEQNEKRLDLLSSLKKKYGSNISEINQYLDKIKFEYNRLISSAATVSELLVKKQALENKLLSIGGELSKTRKVIAKKFEEKMTNELVSLGMKNAEFVVDFKRLDDADYSGLDRVEFMFSANAGQLVMPLSRIASGGEMSRLMLSIKNIAGSSFGVDTMIFDEIDTGVSGHIAGVIAQKLSSISHNRQVICVTHLSQIASFGNRHYYIEKQTVDGIAKTTLKMIEGEERVLEIARLIGGKITEHSLSHASEMLNEGKEFYKNFK